MEITSLPPQYAAAFNPMSVGLYTPNDETKENYVAKINIVYDPLLCIQLTPVDINKTSIQVVDPTNYKIGDSVFYYDRSTTDGTYSGYYTVLDIGNDGMFDTITLDLSMTIPSPVSMIADTISYMYHYISYNMEPINEFVNLDIHNTIKDFVGTSLYAESFSVVPTGIENFMYGLIFGEEYNYVYNFDDNIFATVVGGLGFINYSLTDPTEVPFQVGDVINITQDRQEWLYENNQFDSGSLAFTNTSLSSSHNFQPGDLIYVEGQSTYPESNGYVKVLSTSDAYNLVTEKTFPGSTGAEGGSIFGYPVPQNDGVATIVAIYYDGTAGGLVIETDKGFTESTAPISGKIRLVNNKKFGNNIVETSITFTESTFPVYSFAHICRFDKQHYSRFNPNENFPITSSAIYLFIGEANTNLWSTILSQDTVYYDYDDNEIQVQGLWNRIDKMSPGFILFRQQHFSESFPPSGPLDNFYDADAPISAKFFKYNCYDKSKNIIGSFYIDTIINTTYVKNYYAPTSLFQIAAEMIPTGISGFNLNTEYNNIYYFDIQAFADPTSDDFPMPGAEISTKIRFGIDQDCSSLPTYHLTWLDSFGSYIAFPFKYNTEQSTDVKRNSFYKNEGQWSNGLQIRSGLIFPGTEFSESTTDRGENTYNVNSRTKMKLTSGWLKDNENIIFEDLMKSADVYITFNDNNMSKQIKTTTTSPLTKADIEKIGNNYNTYAVTLEPNNIEYKSNYANEYIFNYSPIVRFAFNDVRYNTNYNNKPVVTKGGPKSGGK